MRSHVTATRPRYGVMDVVALLFRELLLMILIFAVIFGIGAAVVMTMKKTYTAGASLFVGVGQEYVYQPRVGMGERAMPPSAAEVAQSEAAILNSLEVKRRVVRALGVESFQEPGAPAPADPTRQEAAAVRAVAAGLGVEVTPLSPVIGLSYKSDDPAKSARILNTVIDQYLTYRREVFQDRATAAIRTQRQTFEDELGDADRAYEEFLRTNNIGDFATAKSTIANSYQSVFTERMGVQAQLQQASQRLATLVAQMSRTPAEVALHQDLNVSAQDQILQLRTERESLLARYQPDAQPVREIDSKIAQMQAYVGTGTAVGAKEVRTGPNPVWVELETTRINAQADRDSLAARLAVLDRQLSDLRSRQTRLTELESRNSTLAGNREVLTASIREFQQRETQSRADNELVKAGADNVTVIERAQPPSKGKSMRMPLMVAVLLFAGFTALCVGLLRVFLRPGFAIPSTLSRTLHAPVLAVAPAKGA
ncbi:MULTISPECIES: GumC family protein [Brevundimonas]|uniref:GumC family protein n=1 Tax=Brevundimonas TaxID=41275 RepID=UPI001F2A2886|nr:MULTISPECIES: chain-length determining protein [Brevundimonas]MDA0743811.1 chain-length determining protein [Pseudomonadota bacterium]